MSFLFSLLARFDAIWSLLLISALLGVVMLWTFGRLSNQAAIRRTRNRLKANLLEMRLFGDEPALVFRAQRELLTGNLRLLALTLRPSLILSLPLILLLSLLDPFYGRTPLLPGAPALVTVHMRRPLDGAMPPPRLETPASITVETPAVRSLTDNEVSWRIRPAGAVDGSLRVLVASEVIEKHVAAGTERGYASELLASSWMDWFLHPAEGRLHSDSVEWVSVAYPSSNVAWLGVELHWLIWLVVVSFLVALLLKRRMGVSF